MSRWLGVSIALALLNGLLIPLPHWLALRSVASAQMPNPRQLADNLVTAQLWSFGFTAGCSGFVLLSIVLILFGPPRQRPQQ